MSVLFASWRRLRRALGLFSLGPLLVVGACVAAGPKYPFLNSFCQARASAECSHAVVLDCAIADVSTCVAKRQNICVASAPPNTVYNPAAGEGCVDEVSRAYADAQLTLAESQAVDAACLPVFNGPGTAGAPCQADTDCEVSAMLRCVLAPQAQDGGPAAAQGTCQVPDIVMAGYSCAQPNAQCATGFHCGATSNCDVDGLAGASCSSTAPCGPGLTCGASGTCQAKGADGTSCATGDDCLHGLCNKASTDPMGLCVSQVTLSPTEPFCVESR